MIFKWAVRVGQSLPTRFGLNGAARELVVVQIVVNCVGIRGVPKTLTQWSLYISGSAETFFGGYEQKYTSEWRAINYIFLSTVYVVNMTLTNLQRDRGMCISFFEPAGVASTSPKSKCELEKVAFSSSGPHLFPSFTTCQKNPFATHRTVLQRAKKLICNRSQFRTLFLPHRFIKIRPSHQRPVSIEFLTICRIPGFPKCEQNRKSCGNVRIWRKRASVRRKNHSNLK